MSLVTVSEFLAGDIPDEQVDIVATKIVLIRQRQCGGTIIQLDGGKCIHTKEVPKVVGARLALALRKIKGDGTA